MMKWKLKQADTVEITLLQLRSYKLTIYKFVDEELCGGLWIQWQLIFCLFFEKVGDARRYDTDCYRRWLLLLQLQPQPLPFQLQPPTDLSYPECQTMTPDIVGLFFNKPLLIK